MGGSRGGRKTRGPLVYGCWEQGCWRTEKREGDDGDLPERARSILGVDTVRHGRIGRIWMVMVMMWLLVRMCGIARGLKYGGAEPWRLLLLITEKRRTAARVREDQLGECSGEHGDGRTQRASSWYGLG